MFLVKSKQEKKAKKLKSLSYDSTPNYSFFGKTFLSKVLDVSGPDSLTVTIKINDIYYKINCKLNGICTPNLNSPDTYEEDAANLTKKYLFYLLTKQKISTECPDKLIRKICYEVNSIVLINCYHFDQDNNLLIDVISDDVYINNKLILDGYALSCKSDNKPVWNTYFKPVTF